MGFTSVHYHDESTDSIQTQVTRLAPARAVTTAGIPCVVWSEDALSFAFFVPTGLFNFEMLVPDHLVEDAARAIESSLPYVRTSPHHSWREFKIVDVVEANFFPRSVCLEWTPPTPGHDSRSEDDPKFVCVHPASHFQFDIFDLNRSMSLAPPLPSENDKIRFPTRVAFFDSLIDTFLDPPQTETGMWHSKAMRKLSVFLSYLYLYTLRNRPFAEDEESRSKLELDEESATILASLKDENKRYFKKRALGQQLDWLEEVNLRRSLLAQKGRPSLRPIPTIITKFLGKGVNAIQPTTCNSSSGFAGGATVH